MYENIGVPPWDWDLADICKMVHMHVAEYLCDVAHMVKKCNRRDTRYKVQDKIQETLFKVGNFNISNISH